MFLTPNFKLKPLKLKHVPELYRKIWSVGSITLPMGYNPFITKFQAYVRYLDIVLNRDLDYYVIVDTNDKVCGMFRFEHHNKFCTVGYGIVPECRGQGLLDACMGLCKHWSFDNIYAIVFDWNDYSRKALERNGFELINDCIAESKVSYCYKPKR